MRKCDFCGKYERNDNYIFCPTCGTRFPSTEPMLKTSSANVQTIAPAPQQPAPEVKSVTETVQPVAPAPQQPEPESKQVTETVQPIASAWEQPAPEVKLVTENVPPVASAPKQPEPEKTKKMLEMVLDSPNSFTFKAINFVRWLFVVAGFLLGLLLLVGSNFLCFLFMALSAIALSPAIDNKIPFLSNQKAARLILQLACSFILFIISFYFIK